MANYKDLLATRIETIIGETNDNVIDQLAQRELNKRATAIVKVLDLLDAAAREHRKANPDQISVNADGTKNVTYTKDAWDKRLKCEERIKKMEDALSKAFEGNMDKVYELANAAPKG